MDFLVDTSLSDSLVGPVKEKDFELFNEFNLIIIPIFLKNIRRLLELEIVGGQRDAFYF